MSTSFAAGTPPDLFLLNYRFYGQFAARDVLEPVEERVDDSDVFQQEDFYEQAMDAFRFDGKLTCLPQNISSLVVYYNKDMFKEAGVAEPKAGWKWDDMVAAAKKLTKDSDGDGKAEVYGLGVEASIIRLAPFVWSNGGELVDDDEKPTHFTLDTPEAEEALRALLPAPRRRRRSRPATRRSRPRTTRRASRTAAWPWCSRRAARRRPSARSRTSTGTSPRCRSTSEQAGILHSDAYCMTKASENKDAAWSFMEYALGPEGAPIVAKSGRTVPSLKSVAESDAFLDPTAKPANSQVFLDTIPVIRQVPSISTWPEIEDAAEPILEEGFYNGEGVRRGRSASCAQATDRSSRAPRVSASLMAGLRFAGVRKDYGSVRALRGLDLEVADGELLVLVGPSGSGKSTRPAGRRRPGGRRPRARFTSAGAT